MSSFRNIDNKGRISSIFTLIHSVSSALWTDPRFRPALPPSSLKNILQWRSHNNKSFKFSLFKKDIIVYLVAERCLRLAWNSGLKVSLFFLPALPCLMSDQNFLALCGLSGVSGGSFCLGYSTGWALSFGFPSHGSSRPVWPTWALRTCHVSCIVPLNILSTLPF